MGDPIISARHPDSEIAFDDLSREVYCILGIPVDVIEMASLVRHIEFAADTKRRLLITTPNLNFLVNSMSDPYFRRSLIVSDICPADGMPIVWIARLLGVPIKHRLAGSDLFNAIRLRPSSARPLKVFLFGGAEGVAAAAAQVINAKPSGLYCVGSLYPGFGTVEMMSESNLIQEINSSNADFLAASLGAKKGQSWLLRNHYDLLVPVRAHLGAAVNFEAGTLRRAPLFMQKCGLEWLWRIREEPYLWRRYFTDGNVLLGLLVKQVLPLIAWKWWMQLKSGHRKESLIITQIRGDKSVTLSFSGPVSATNIEKIVGAFKGAIGLERLLVIDLTNATWVDPRFLGLLLVSIKTTGRAGVTISLTGLSPGLERIFRLNGVGFLLSPGEVAK